MESASVHAKQRGTISRKGAKQRTSELLKSEGVGVFVGVIECDCFRRTSALRRSSPVPFPRDMSSEPIGSDNSA